MKQGQAIELDNIQARLVNGVWHAQQVGTPFHGRGESVEAACSDLAARIKDYQEFSDISGLQAFEPRDVGSKAGRLLSGFWRNFRVVVIVALCSIPLSYAISTGVRNGLDLDSLKGGREFWTKVEQAVLEQGAEDKQLPPEKVEQMSKALNNIINQVRPFTSQLPLLFEPQQRTQVPQTQISSEAEAKGSQ